MRLLRFLALTFALALAAPAFLCLTAPAAVAQEAELPDFAAWERFAKSVEETLAKSNVPQASLEQMRKQLVEWRTRFSAAQGVNAAQIDTVRQQIAALGPAPAEGETEAPDIAQRRKELNAKLSELQAPVLAAEEARRRADGLIRQIDTLVRERQTSELLTLAPTPVNPVNWPAGWAVLSQGIKTLGTEVADAWASEEKRAELQRNLPLILLYLAVATFLVLRGPGIAERLTTRLLRSQSMRARRVAAATVSLGQVIVPVLGAFLLVQAVIVTGMTGTRLRALIEAVPQAVGIFFTARWVSSWLFRSDGFVELLTQRAGEARFHVNMLSLVLAAESFRVAFITEVRPPLSLAAKGVWGAPLVVMAGVLLFRFGLILRPRQIERGAEFRDTILRWLGTATVAVSIVAPLLALIGYVNAANALIWPAIMTLGLLGLIVILQRFLAELYLLILRREDEERDALVPVLIGFALAILAIPLLALIWGARTEDLLEWWTRFSEGISIGQTRISPSVFFAFVFIFLLGYGLTRLVQSALRSTILPRTKLKKGAQTAIVSGVGYLGIFLAALIAIVGAGIDLSSLAIVAGALSVGIGFGLQNIVQNFVSGIILLIEQPIAEGDMIEVNGQFGTVRGISVRSTIIETFDRTDLIVPNADLISGVVTNLTRTNTMVRLIIPVGVAYGSDTRKVQAILKEIAENHPLVLVDPAPAVHFVAFGADSLNFEIRCILSDVNFKLDVQTEILHQIVERFAQEGIEIPFPQRDIWLRNPEALRQAPEPPAAPQPPTPSETRLATRDDTRGHDPALDGDDV
ncbi:DUF3772 domain-containing protein [Albidovulum inexpectatum]|nr:DUF3772 domain-containing protein [Albidovulum inexpectatum]